MSKLGVRALGVSIGGGQTAGFGASFALLYAGNIVHALVGDGAQITAESLKVVARRERMDESQYKFPFDISDLFTVGATKDKDKGLFTSPLITTSATLPISSLRPPSARTVSSTCWI